MLKFSIKGYQKVLIISAIIILLLATVLPVLAFLMRFSGYSISDSPEHWAMFGDYIGGTINPIIAIASLVVLIYITILVSKNEQDNEKNRFLLERKMIAYDELAKHISNLAKFRHQIIELTAYLTTLGPLFRAMQESISSESDVDLENLNFDPIEKIKFLNERQQELKAKEKEVQGYIGIMYNKARDSGKVFLELHILLNSFNLRYGHIFRYDFEDESFTFIKNEVSDLAKHYISIPTHSAPSGDFHKVIENLKQPSDDFGKHFDKAINDIRDEIISDKND